MWCESAKGGGTLEKIRVARLSVISNTILVLAKLGVGLSIHSVGVIAEAIHSGLDLVAALIAYFSVREANKPADKEHPFGHGKIENLSGTIEAVLILITAAWILYEATRRLFEGGFVANTGPGLLVMGLSAGMNLLVSKKLFQAARAADSVALEADALHLRADVYTSLGVFAGLLLISLTGLQIFDPLMAILVALLILRAAYQLIKTSTLPLLDISLPAGEQEQITQVLDGFRHRYLDIYRVRTRKAGAERFVDLQMVLPKAISISEAHRLCDEIERALETRLPNIQVMIHVEPCDHEERPHCQSDCGDCSSGVKPTAP